MAIGLDHTIVAATDAHGSAHWYAEMLGLASPVRFGPFWQITTDNGVNLDFHTHDGGPVASQHYAFLIGEDDFDAVYGRIVDRGLAHYADPAGQQHGAINHNDGGRGVYFPDPDGHWLEVITRPYGGGG